MNTTCKPPKVNTMTYQPIRALFICLEPYARPLNDMTASEVLRDEGRFTNFIRALDVSGVGDMLEKKGPYTVFAPGDEVFNEHNIGALTSTYRLMDYLNNFIVPGKYMLEDIERLQVLQTVGGHPLLVTFRDGVEVCGARIIKPNVPYNNGVIHEIDMPLDSDNLAIKGRTGKY
jgi:uncharacterized surface protein with fasciclin (FAS1) repeats